MKNKKMTQDPDHQYMGIKNDFDRTKSEHMMSSNAGALNNGPGGSNRIIHRQTLFDNSSEPIQISEAGDESMLMPSNGAGYNPRNSFA